MSEPNETEQRALAERAAALWVAPHDPPTFPYLARREWWRLATTPEDARLPPAVPWTVDELGSIPAGLIDPRDRMRRRW